MLKVSRKVLTRLFPELKNVETTKIVRVRKVDKDVLTLDEEHFDYIILRKGEQPLEVYPPFYTPLLTENAELDTDGVVLLIKQPHDDERLTQVFLPTRLNELLQTIVEEEIRAVRKLLE